MLESVWKQCLDHLEAEIPLHQFETWIRPLQPQAKGDELHLLAPNQYVRDHVHRHYSESIRRSLTAVDGDHPCRLVVAVGSLPPLEGQEAVSTSSSSEDGEPLATGLRAHFTFPNFVEGKSNQLARAAALQVAEKPGNAYNPLLLYGGVGYGKTHLMHAIGNRIAEQPNTRIACLPAMNFVRDLVRSLRDHCMDRFNRYYRSMDALLIDDIQFFVDKEKTQEEFFHAFDDLLQSNHQVVLTCDRYPKEVDGLPDRLTSRFASGISFAIEPPDVETRAAILKSKAALSQVSLSDDVALFLANRIKSNVRELEGALRRVIMGAEFQEKPITEAYCREVLQDVFSVHTLSVTMEKVMKTVADYYNVRVTDLTSKRRHRSIVKPRQIAMALIREFTDHSYPEIGDAFGGRDHTTVLHGCRKVEELRKQESNFDTDYQNLLRRLST